MSAEIGNPQGRVLIAGDKVTATNGLSGIYRAPFTIRDYMDALRGTRDDFRRFVEEKRAWYRKVGKIYCPLLREEVVFNARGFYHLRYHSGGRMRTIAEQRYKLTLLPLAVPAIKNARIIHDHKRWERSGQFEKNYELWELRGGAGKHDANISVILRRIGNGNIAFFSIWRNR